MQPSSQASRARQAQALARICLRLPIVLFVACGVNVLFGGLIAPHLLLAVSVLLWALGLGVGIFALVLRRVTSAPSVLVPASIGIALNGLMLAVFAVRP